MSVAPSEYDELPVVAGESEGAAAQRLAGYIAAPGFKRLFDAIVLAQERTGFRSLAVLSQLPGEGRTFFVSTLALACARFLRRRVLIMDTISQTRRESVYLTTLLGESAAGPEGAGPGVGLIDLMTTRTLYRELERCRAEEAGDTGVTVSADNRTGIHELGIRGAGIDPGEPADFHIGALVRSLRQQYDLMLLDTCALGEANRLTIDPVVLARQVDAAVLVTTDRSLDRDMLRRVQRELQQRDIALIGTVFNPGVVP